MSGRIKTFFTHNWPKKSLSLLLAIIIWFLINKSVTSAKTVNNVRVRVKNVPANKALFHANAHNILNKRVKVTLRGNHESLSHLTGDDFEIVLDAEGKPSNWLGTVTKYNLNPTNPSINLSKQVAQVTADKIAVSLTNLVTKKIPIVVTRSISNAPVGYEFLNIWPTKLHMSVSGPEELLDKLTAKGYNFTYNLTNIPSAELDALLAKNSEDTGSVVSYFIPDEYKQIFLPELSSSPLQINDPKASELRVDLIRDEYLPFSGTLPLAIHVAPGMVSSVNLKKLAIKASPLIKTRKGIHTIAKPLMVKGVSPYFLSVVKNNIQLLISIDDKNSSSISTSLQFINPKALEDQFVAYCMENNLCNHLSELSPLLAKDYLRHRFKTYMQHMQLFYDKDSLVDLKPTLEEDMIVLHEREYEL